MVSNNEKFQKKRVGPLPKKVLNLFRNDIKERKQAKSFFSLRLANGNASMGITSSASSSIRSPGRPTSSNNTPFSKSIIGKEDAYFLELKSNFKSNGKQLNGLGLALSKSFSSKKSPRCNLPSVEEMCEAGLSSKDWKKRIQQRNYRLFLKSKFRKWCKRLDISEDDDLVFKETNKIIVSKEDFPNLVLKTHLENVSSGSFKKDKQLHLSNQKTYNKLKEKFSMGRLHFGLSYRDIRKILQTCEDKNCAKRNIVTKASGPYSSSSESEDTQNETEDQALVNGESLSETSVTSTSFESNNESWHVPNENNNKPKSKHRDLKENLNPPLLHTEQTSVQSFSSNKPFYAVLNSDERHGLAEHKTDSSTPRRYITYQLQPLKPTSQVPNPLKETANKGERSTELLKILVPPFSDPRTPQSARSSAEKIRAQKIETLYRQFLKKIHVTRKLVKIASIGENKARLGQLNSRFTMLMTDIQKIKGLLNTEC